MVVHAVTGRTVEAALFIFGRLVDCLGDFVLPKVNTDIGGNIILEFQDELQDERNLVLYIQSCSDPPAEGFGHFSCSWYLQEDGERSRGHTSDIDEVVSIVSEFDTGGHMPGGGQVITGPWKGSIGAILGIEEFPRE
jgi:hypothetical protein